MYPKYTARQLYTQLQYFEALVDVPRATRKRQRRENEEKSKAQNSKVAKKPVGDQKPMDVVVELPAAKSVVGPFFL